MSTEGRCKTKNIVSHIPHILFGICMLFIALMTASFIDLNRAQKLTFDINAKLDWIAIDLGIERALLHEPSAIKILPQKELEKMFVEIYPEDSLRRETVITVLKLILIEIRGFYDPLQERIFLSEELASNGTLLHELVHHALFLAVKNEKPKGFSDVPIPDNGEYVARDAARRYTEEKLSFFNLFKHLHLS